MLSLEISFQSKLTFFFKFAVIDRDGLHFSNEISKFRCQSIRNQRLHSLRFLFSIFYFCNLWSRICFLKDCIDVWKLIENIVDISIMYMNFIITNLNIKNEPTVISGLIQKVFNQWGKTLDYLFPNNSDTLVLKIKILILNQIFSSTRTKHVAL